MESDINIPPANPGAAQDKKIGKKQYLIGALAIFVLILLGFFVREYGEKEESLQGPEETLAEKQTKELDALREEFEPLTQEELGAQADELEQARGESEPLTQEEINAQSEELNNLRQQ